MNGLDWLDALNEAISQTYRNDKSRYIRNTLLLNELKLAKIERKKYQAMRVAVGLTRNIWLDKYVDWQEIGVVCNTNEATEKTAEVKWFWTNTNWRIVAQVLSVI